MSSKKENANKRGIVEYLSLKAELSSDALAGEVRVEIRGRSSLFLGGCKKILKYSPEEMIVECKGDRIIIAGERLVCTSYHAGNISVDGSIASVSFSNGEEKK